MHTDNHRGDELSPVLAGYMVVFWWVIMDYSPNCWFHGVNNFEAGAGVEPAFPRPAGGSTIELTRNRVPV